MANFVLCTFYRNKNGKILCTMKCTNNRLHILYFDKTIHVRNQHV